MNRLQEDLHYLEEILEQAKLTGIDFLAQLETLSTSHQAGEVKASKDLPEGGGALDALQLFKAHYLHLITASSGPRYWGFVTGGTTPAALIGDWLCSVFDQNPQSVTLNGDISAHIEHETIKLMRRLFSLPDSFNGSFVSGATLSNFTGLAVARQWAGEQLQHNIASDGMLPGIKVLSANPHSSVLKSLAMLGFGRNQLVQVKSKPHTESIDLGDLESLLAMYQDSPIILSASAGTVNTSDFDDLQAIAELKRQYKFWLHIDAAFGGFAACTPKYASLLQGWETADSITIDGHKWMNVPYDSAVAFVRHEHQNLQIQTFQNSNAPYLGNPATNFSFASNVPENSRRLRALPAWFSLIAYGREGFKNIVENSIQLAQQFGGFIAKSENFELLAPVKLNTVCFTLKHRKEQVDLYLDTLNKLGKVYLTPTVYAGQRCMRAAFVNWRTSANDLEIAKESMQQAYNTCFIS